MPASPAELLVAAIQLRGATEIQAEVARRLLADQNPRALCDQAIAHGVFPLLHALLERAARTEMTGEAKRLFERTRAVLTMRNEALIQELRDLVGLFEREGLRVLAFKGPVLGQLVYGDPNLRQFVDLDFLVRKSDFPRVAQLLMNRGYAPGYKLTPRQERAHLERDMELSFIGRHRRIAVDLHWRLAVDYHGVDLEVERIFAKAPICELRGTRVLSMSAEDMLLYQCFHGARDGWNRLCLVRDLAGLAQCRDDWDWPRLIVEARRRGLLRSLLLGLLLGEMLTGLALHPSVREAAGTDRRMLAFGQRLASRLSNGPARSGRSSSWRVGWLLMQMRGTRRERLHYLLVRAFLPTARDWDAIRLPDWLFALYYLLRPIRLILGFGRRG